MDIIAAIEERYDHKTQQALKFHRLLIHRGSELHRLALEQIDLSMEAALMNCALAFMKLANKVNDETDLRSIRQSIIQAWLQGR